MPWLGQYTPEQITPVLGSIFSLTASGHKAAFVFQVPKSGTLNRFGFRSGTGVANTPDMRLSFQDLTGANPDETQDQYADVLATAASSWIEPASYMGSGGEGSGTKRSVTAGDWLACVIEFVSFAGGDSFDFSITAENFGITQNGYTNVKNTGAWAISTNGRPNLMALLYDGDADYTPVGMQWWAPFHAFTNEGTFSSSTNPDERGLRFQFPVDCEIDGIDMSVVSLDTADAEFVLYDAASGVLVSQALVVSRQLGPGFSQHRVWFPPVAISANTTYRAVIKATSPSTAAALKTFSVPSNALMSAVEPGTREWYYTTRNDGGAWTDTDTKRPWFRVHVPDSFLGVVGVSGGGGSYGFVG